MATLGSIADEYEGRKTLAQIAEETEPEPTTIKRSVPGGFLLGVQKGFMDIPRGLKERDIQLRGLIGSGTSEDLKKFREETTQREKEYKGKVGEGLAPKVGEVVGGLAPFLAVPGPGEVGIAGRLLYGAGTGAGMALTQPTKEGESLTKNALVGAGSGLVGSGVMEAAGKTYNIIKGKLAKPAWEKMVELSKKTGVPLTVGEIMQNPFVQKLESILENVPVVGTGTFRKVQNEASQNLAESTMGRYGSGTLSAAQERMQTSMLHKLEVGKGKVEAAYGVIRNEVAKEGGLTRIPTTEIREITEQLLDTYPDIFKALGDQKLEGVVLKYISKETKGVVTGRAQGAAITPYQQQVEARYVKYEDMEFLRKRLGGLINKAYKKEGVGEVGSEEVNFLVRLKASVDKDLENWAINHPNTKIVQAAKTARQTYIDEVVPFKDALINNATRLNYDTDQMFQTFIKPGREKLAGKLTEAMEPSGVQATKYAILRHAYDKADPEKTGLKVFSPATFSNEIKRLNDVNKKIFTTTEMSELEGVTNILTAAQASGQYMARPLTGHSLNPYYVAGAAGIMTEKFATAMGGGIPGYAAGLAATGGIVEIVTQALTSKVGRNILLAASKIEPQSPKMLNIINQLYNLAPKLVTVAEEKLTK